VKKVAIIILNYNDWSSTKECLESLKAVTYGNLETILIDNGAVSIPCAELQRSFPSVIYVRNKKNLGFAGGNNQGVAMAFKRGADYVFLLNNDTVVDAEIIQRLVDAHEEYGPGCVLGCKIMAYRERSKIQSCGSRFTFKNGDLSSTMIGEGEVDRGQYDVIEECDFISGCALFTSKELIEKIGLFDENFFLIWEDTEFGVRNKRAGGRNITIPLARLWHKGQQSTHNKPHPIRFYLNARNKLYFLSKHGDYLNIDVGEAKQRMWEEHRSILRSGYWLKYTAAYAYSRGIRDFERNQLGVFPGWLEGRQEKFLEYRLRLAKNNLSKSIRGILRWQKT
jgi:GT2 family glycosyltransferase